MNPIKDIGGKIKSNIVLKKVNTRLTSVLVDKIGASSILGRKNYEFYYKKIGDMIKNGKHQEAMDYANQEAIKVRNQVQEENTIKRSKYKSL